MMREDLPIQTEREKKSESYLSNREIFSLFYQEDGMNLSLATIKLDVIFRFDSEFDWKNIARHRKKKSIPISKIQLSRKLFTVVTKKERTVDSNSPLSLGEIINR